MLICPLKISLLRTSDRAGKRYSTVVEGCKLKLLLILHLILIPRQDDPEYLNGLASGPLEGHDIVLDVVWKTHFRCSLKGRQLQPGARGGKIAEERHFLEETKTRGEDRFV